MNVKELKELPANRRIILPIDTRDLERGLALAIMLKDHIWGAKLGLIPNTEHGINATRRFRELGMNVMADPKLHDIPNTVSGAADIYHNADADLCTMHATMGRRAMKAVSSACGENMLSLAVTVLTSISEEECIEIYGALPQVVVPRLAKLALSDQSAHGIVCSPVDLEVLREELDNFSNTLFVTPGVRPAGSDADDQARVATPRQAISNGATLLVIGRAITQAKDPLSATKAIVEEIAKALDEKGV